jgi:hypothetical protein
MNYRSRVAMGSSTLLDIEPDALRESRVSGQFINCMS